MKQGSADYIEFYNLLGFQISPNGTTYINSEETKEIVLKVSAVGNLKQRGFYTFDYYIRGSDGTEMKQTLTMEIIDLKDAFEAGSGNIDTESQSIQIYIYNKNNFNFGNVRAKFSSAFFNFNKEFSLGPYERKIFDVQLNKEDFNSLMAGFYTLNVDVEVEGKTAEVEGVIKSVEKDIDAYEFGQALHTLYDFVWHEFADKYIEESKKRNDIESQRVLYYCLLEILKMLHPFMPHLTEEIYQNLPQKNKELLMIEEW